MHATCHNGGNFRVYLLDQSRLRPLHHVLAQTQLAGVTLTKGQHTPSKADTKWLFSFDNDAGFFATGALRSWLLGLRRVLAPLFRFPLPLAPSGGGRLGVSLAVRPLHGLLCCYVPVRCYHSIDLLRLTLFNFHLRRGLGILDFLLGFLVSLGGCFCVLCSSCTGHGGLRCFQTLNLNDRWLCLDDLDKI